MRMLRNIEFLTFEDEVWYRVGDELKKLTEGDPIIRDLIDHIEKVYPGAFAALHGLYKRSSPNIPYYRFLIVRRFCKCNFGCPNPRTPDIDADGGIHIEDIHCPLRGECPHENVICYPQINSKISDAEMRVISLLYQGVPRREIAEELHLSELTIDNHIRNARVRIWARNESSLIAYASKHNLLNIK